MRARRRCASGTPPAQRRRTRAAHIARLARLAATIPSMSEPTNPRPAPVRQLRLVVETEDFDAAVAFYRDALGLPESESYEGEDDARVVILSAGIATLELSNPAQVRLIDRVEADGLPSHRLRVAFEVDDTTATTDRLVGAGAVLTATPRETPWRSLNSRMDAPAGLQITLFQELDAGGAVQG